MTAPTPLPAVTRDATVMLATPVVASIGSKSKFTDRIEIMFTAKGLRSFPIEYFTPAEIAKATAWVGNE